MAPKCARLLSHSRPSASADAISHLGARAVRGPWPEGRKRDPRWVHQRVLSDQSAYLLADYGYNQSMFLPYDSSPVLDLTAELDRWKAQLDYRGPVPRSWAGRLRRDLEAEAVAAST